MEAKAITLNESLALLTADKADVQLDQKVASYTALACSLKSVSSNVSIPEAVFRQRNKLILVVLNDVAAQRGDLVSSSAIQALGYILFNELVARCIDDELVTKIITALLDVIRSDQSSKQMCTRALWCLANQNLQNTVIMPHISQIVTSLKQPPHGKMMQISSVAFETLSVLQKLYSQCKFELIKNSQSWYTILICLLLSKQIRVQIKAIEFAETLEQCLMNKASFSSWLFKELKENVLESMNMVTGSKASEVSNLMKIWKHFVKILGKTLYKSGSFLNEMLKVVEAGFKNHSVEVQTGAYKAWITLIDDFALDRNVLTNQKRLRLLLLPLLGSPVKQRTNAVDEARIQTWWHLIIQLLSVRSTDELKERIFCEVCAPFLLFTLGLDPKTNLSKCINELSASSQHTTPCHIYAQLSKPIPSKPTSLYPSVPSERLLHTGCYALLMFLGSDDNGFVMDTIVKRLPSDIYLESIPKSTLLSFLIFIEGCVHNQTMLSTPLLEQLTYEVINIILSKVSPAPLNDMFITFYGATDLLFRLRQSLPAYILAPLFIRYTDLVPFLFHSRMGMWSNVLCLGMRLVTLHFDHLSADEKKHVEQLCVSILDKSLEDSRVGRVRYTILDKEGPYAMIIDHMKSLVSCNEFTIDKSDSSLTHRLWDKVGVAYTQLLSPTNVSNASLSKEPNYNSIRSLLLFPFLHGFIQNEDVNLNNVLHVWKDLFSTGRTYFGLIAKDTNTLMECVTDDLIIALAQVHNEKHVYMPDRYLECILRACTILLDIIHPMTRDVVTSASPVLSIARLLELCLVGINKIVTAGPFATMKSPSTALWLVSSIFQLPLLDDAVRQIILLLATPLSTAMSCCLSKSEDLDWRRMFIGEVGVVWKSICTCFQTRLNGSFVTSTLKLISPLLEVVLLCKHTGIIETTVDFWSNTFGKSYCLEYSLPLRRALSVFKKVHKGQFKFNLPGFIALPDRDVINVSMLYDQSDHVLQESQPEVVLPHPLISTPSKPQRDKENPAKRKRAENPVAKEKDYVVARPVGSSPKQSRILTEHQKEKLKERPLLPAMYTSVEPSLNTQPFEVEQENTLVSNPNDEDGHVIVESPPTSNGYHGNNLTGTGTPIHSTNDNNGGSDPSNNPIPMSQDNLEVSLTPTISTSLTTPTSCSNLVATPTDLTPTIQQDNLSDKNSKQPSTLSTNTSDTITELTLTTPTNTTETLTPTRKHNTTTSNHPAKRRKRGRKPRETSARTRGKAPARESRKRKQDKEEEGSTVKKRRSTTKSAKVDTDVIEVKDQTPPIVSVAMPPPTEKASATPTNVNLATPINMTCNLTHQQLVDSIKLSAASSGVTLSPSSQKALLDPKTLMDTLKQLIVYSLSNAIPSPGIQQSSLQTILNSYINNNQGQPVVTSAILPTNYSSPASSVTLATPTTSVMTMPLLNTSTNMLPTNVTVLQNFLNSYPSIGTPILIPLHSNVGVASTHPSTQPSVASNITGTNCSEREETVCTTATSELGSTYSEDDVDVGMECDNHVTNISINVQNSRKDDKVTSDVPSLVQLALAAGDKYNLKKFPSQIQSLAAGMSGGSPVSTPLTPTHEPMRASPRLTPAGILKHTSQFDTPLSASKIRRVQFASPVVVGKQDAPPTPVNEKDSTQKKTSKTARSPRRSPFSSRRTLLLMGPTVQPATPTNEKTADEIVFPALTSCQSSVEQILPALSPSGKFTHGLYNVVHARNISTIGNLSSLTENEVQSLPIKSPKVPNLRNVLRNFEIKMTQQGQRKKNLSSSKENDGETTKAKQLRLDESSLESTEEDPLITLSTPDSQVTGANDHVTSNDQNVLLNKNSTGGEEVPDNNGIMNSRNESDENGEESCTNNLMTNVDDHVTGDHVTDSHVTGDHMTGDNVTGDNVTDDHVTDDHVTGDHVIGDHVTDDHVTDDHVTDFNGGDTVEASLIVDVGVAQDNDNLTTHSNTSDVPMVTDHYVTCVSHDHLYTNPITIPNNDSTLSNDDVIVDSQDLFPSDNMECDLYTVNNAEPFETTPTEYLSPERIAEKYPPLKSGFVAYLSEMLSKFTEPSFVEQFNKDELDAVMDGCLSAVRAIHFNRH